MTKRIIITFKGWGADTYFKFKVENSFSENNLNLLVSSIGKVIIEQVEKFAMCEELEK